MRRTIWRSTNSLAKKLRRHQLVNPPVGLHVCHKACKLINYTKTLCFHANSRTFDSTAKIMTTPTGSTQQSAGSSHPDQSFDSLNTIYRKCLRIARSKTGRVKCSGGQQSLKVVECDLINSFCICFRLHSAYVYTICFDSIVEVAGSCESISVAGESRSISSTGRVKCSGGQQSLKVVECDLINSFCLCFRLQRVRVYRVFRLDRRGRGELRINLSCRRVAIDLVYRSCKMFRRPTKSQRLLNVT
jgi:hypothetical protein